MLQKTPAEQTNRLKQENGLGRIIRTFDPDVPGYLFWTAMLMLIAFHQLVLHVR
jgi:hypothetical protein